MSTVDVFVPCYNYARYLRQCVDSILTQYGVDVRVLVIDDCSTDNTPEVGHALALEDSRVEFRRHHTNKGHIATYNEGIAWASGKYCLLLSADDFLLPGALARAAAIMNEAPNVGFIFGQASILFEDTGQTRSEIPMVVKSRGQAVILQGRAFVRHSGMHNIVPTPTAVVRTALQHRLGGYRTNLPHSGDMEMWLRLAARTDVGYVNEPQAVYRRHSANMSHSYAVDPLLDLHQIEAALNYFFASATDVDWVSRERPALLRSLAKHALSRASGAFNQGDRQAMERVVTFARELSPGVPLSVPYLKLAAKLALGHRIWAAASRLREAVLGAR